jgi:hypothetical protein
MKHLLLYIAASITFCSVSASRPIDTALERTVMIIVFDEQSQPISIGSGFVVSDEGHVATNYHVIEGGSSAVVKFQGSEEFEDVLEITHKSPSRDIAVIRVGRKSEALNILDDTSILVGQGIYAIGNPEGLEGTLSEGIISGFRKINDEFRLMQITAPISPGSSGGPVITKEGHVIGIATASLVTGQNLNFAIPATELKNLLNSPPLNEVFSKSSLPESTESFAGTTTTSRDLVSVFNFKVTGNSADGSASISFSIRNENKKDITDLKLVLIWKNKDGEEVHFSPVLIQHVIPSRMTKSINKKNLLGVGNVINFGTVDDGVEVRVLDYKILKSTGHMNFF